jgi:protein-S-isoprenylcysteine O-methyltransferase Ste14
MLADERNPAAVDTAERSAQSKLPRRLHRLLWSPAWDVATRGVGLLWTAFLLLISVRNLLAFLAGEHAGAMSPLVLATAVAARLAFLAFLALLLLFFVVRRRPLAKARGLGARAVALFGTYSPTCFALLPRYDDSAALNLTSFACIAVGNVLAVYSVVFLNRSASIMAEARRLVTIGPYRFVQHPVYLFEEIAVVGAMLPFLWPPSVALIALVLFAAQVACQFRRMSNEEAVLEATFPDYAEYRRRTARLLPGLY